jgi:hypothetical protein
MGTQLMAALRQYERPIVIEDQDLARPFVRLLRTRDMKLRPLGAIVAEMMSYTIRRCYGSDIENDWYIGGCILPGNVQKVILKSKALHTLRPTGHEAARVHHDAGSPRSGAASAAGDVAIS